MNAQATRCGLTTSTWLRSFRVLLLSLAAGSCSKHVVEVPEAEAARVLEAILLQLNSERHERYVVPRDYSIDFLDDIDWPDDASGWPEPLPDSLLDDFAARSSIPGALPLSESSIGVHSFYEAEDDVVDQTPLMDAWARFYRTYSGSNGLLGFSRVGFSSDRSQALVYVWHYCGDTCGKGGLFHCTLADGAWTVSQALWLWVA